MDYDDDDSLHEEAAQVGGDEGGNASSEVPGQQTQPVLPPSGGGDETEEQSQQVDETTAEFQGMEVEEDAAPQHILAMLHNYKTQPIADKEGFTTREYYMRASTTFALTQAWEKFCQLTLRHESKQCFEGCTIGDIPITELTMDNWSNFFMCTVWTGDNGAADSYRSAPHTLHRGHRNGINILENIKYDDDKKSRTGKKILLRVRWFRQHGAKGNLATKNPTLLPNTNRGGARTPAGYMREIGPLPLRVEERHEPSSTLLHSAMKLITNCAATCTALQGALWIAHRATEREVTGSIPATSAPRSAVDWEATQGWRGVNMVGGCRGGVSIH